MTELLHLESQEAAQRAAEKVSAELKRILNDPKRAAEASMYGSQLPEIVG